VEQEASAGREARAGLAELVGREEQATAPRSCQPAGAEPEINGNTIRSIAAARRIAIGQLRTGLGERRAAIPWPIARLARGNKSAAKVAILRATAQAGVVWGVVPMALALGTMRGEAVWAAELAEAERIASEAGISRVAAAETGMPLAEDPGDITGPALAPAAAEAPPASDPEVVEEASAAAEAGAVAGAAGEFLCGKEEHNGVQI